MQAPARLVDKPRVLFLEEMKIYRRQKQQYYTKQKLFEELLEQMLDAEIAAFKAGVAIPDTPTPKIPVHPL